MCSSQQRTRTKIRYLVDTGTRYVSILQWFYDVVVVDGGDVGVPSIRPPDGVIWHSISVLEGEHIYVQDKVDPHRGLTFAHFDGI